MRALIIVLASVVVLLTTLSMKLWNENVEIAYVRTQELIDGYKGSISTQQVIEKKRGLMKANVDTLALEFQSNVKRLSADAADMTNNQRAIQEQRLQKQRDDISRYVDALEQQSSEEEMNLLEGVLNQINSGVRQYAKEHNIEMVIGTNSSGTVMYGDETLDITNDVLEWLNSNN